jgi:flavin reductase (DIM6/NTAB) family NADH-FMN oxidoreductase RutF
MDARPTPPSEFDLPLGARSLGVSSEEGDDPRIALRRTLGMFATGVTVVTTLEGEQVHGLTVNAFMSVSLEPPLVLVSIERRTRLCGLLGEGRSYGVSVLRESQSGLSDYFAHRADEGVPEPRFDLIHDTPLVEGALAHFVATISRCYWGGDHSLFLGRVEYARYGEGTPLLFHGGRYERLGQVG